MPNAPKSVYRYCTQFCENTPTFSCTPMPRFSIAFDTCLTRCDRLFHDIDFHLRLPKSRYIST